MKPILFNTEMVRAILDGRKTVTRRVIKFPKYIERQGNGLYTLYAEDSGYFDQHFEEIVDYIKKPYQIGDVLYVRETWNILDGKYKYREECGDFDFADNGEKIKFRWKPSIHMPKEAARIFLKVTDVMVERLQDITEEQAIKEGFIPTAVETEDRSDYIGFYAVEKFVELWDLTIKKQDIDTYGWGANPWVWVIEFEQIEKGE